MTADSWIVSSLGVGRVKEADADAGRRRLRDALGVQPASRVGDEDLRFVASGLELAVLDVLEGEDRDALRVSASTAFQIARAVPLSGAAVSDAEQLVRTGCLGVLGDRGADVSRLLATSVYPDLPTADAVWGTRVWATVLDTWLRLLRKRGWDDLDAVLRGVAALRRDQKQFEPAFLDNAAKDGDARPAWDLVMVYHLAKAAEIVATYLAHGVVEKRYDVGEQLDAQFDRAIAAAGRAQLVDRETLARVIARTARVLVENCIWTVTRAVNSRVTKFVALLTSRDRPTPVFEMLPPQRRALSEQGLLGSSKRSVVVSLPTSSGKTIIAEFRMLQALNQFDTERGWVAYLAPTRALVNQLTMRLRRDLGALNVVVEKVSPALEVDGLEAGVLTDADVARQFRVLVTTPEKLDMMLRGGWESRIGRPLTLVVVDEAHGLASSQRGLRLELLLATINRECRDAQFLLLTPFIRNAEEIARWLAPASNQSIDIGLDWSPNDRTIAIVQPIKVGKRGDFTLRLETVHTSRRTLEVPEMIGLPEKRPLGLAWSAVHSSPGKLAAATAQLLHRRGTVIVLVDTPRNSWGVAKALQVPENRVDGSSSDLVHIRRFLADEMGADFPLVGLLEYGVGVHHGGLSEDTRAIVEWLTAKSAIRVLVATTTIAQGVNFPVSGVVFASHHYPPYAQVMPPEDFWNIAGRAGRVDQGDLGVVALAATDDDKAAALRTFVAQATGALNSTLVDLVKKAAEEGKLLQLESLSHQPGWSAFLQFLAHTYRQIGDHERFAAEVEQVLRGTLGFQALRRSHKGWADQLVLGVYSYAERIKGKPLKLVDATGFSWESVVHTLQRVKDQQVAPGSWSPELFTAPRGELRRMMGILLQVPELRDSLIEVTGGKVPDGDMLARILCDWVQGRSLTEMAATYFGTSKDEGKSRDPVEAMTLCCRNIFGRLTQTASWGLAALQALTLGEQFEKLPADEQRVLRNLPARAYYGVNSDEAVALRLLGVPRAAAPRLARVLNVGASEPLYAVRTRLRGAGVATWRSALGDRGDSYHRVWSIIEGDA